MPRNCSGWKSGRNPATTDAPSKIAKVQKMGIIRSDDSGKYFSGNTRKVVKSERRKPLVIAAGGNPAEIHPSEPITQNGET